jgi:hypothetical protein
MSSRIEQVVVERPALTPGDEVLFEVVSGPTSGTEESGVSYTEWRIYVPKKEVDALFERHRRVVHNEDTQQYYETCIISGLSLEEALKATETSR